MNEFLALPQSEEWLELVDGEMVVTPKPFRHHQQVACNLAHLYLSQLALPCESEVSDLFAVME
ncbi:MAG: hypothetical protein O2901_02100 [Verrucomicrobia bacterium]|nr:hypothetical protein [Verrucomicrobiota bacterium]